MNTLDDGIGLFFIVVALGWSMSPAILGSIVAPTMILGLCTSSGKMNLKLSQLYSTDEQANNVSGAFSNSPVALMMLIPKWMSRFEDIGSIGHCCLVVYLIVEFHRWVNNVPGYNFIFLFNYLSTSP